jgi:hypothetical protein
MQYPTVLGFDPYYFAWPAAALLKCYFAIALQHIPAAHARIHVHANMVATDMVSSFHTTAPLRARTSFASRFLAGGRIHI